MNVRALTIVVAAALYATRADAEPPPCNGPGLTMPAAANSHLASGYPILSAVLQEEGSTIVRFVIGTDGKASAPTVLQSSGSLRLDDASVESVRSWLYSPAVAGGVPVACIQRAQVRWIIPDDTSKKAQ